MNASDRAAALLLALVETGEQSVSDLEDVLGVSTDSISDRVALLGTLRDLEADGLVTRETVTVDGESQTVVTVTDSGRERAADQRETLSSREIEVRRDGDAEQSTLGDADRWFDEYPLVQALTQCTDDGILYLGTVDSPSCLGREVERERFEQLLTEKREATTGGVLLCGPPGIGKTTLLDAYREQARAAGYRVVPIVLESNATDPFAPLQRVLADGGITVTAGQDGPASIPDPVTSDGVHEEIAAEREAIRTEYVSAIRELARDEPVLITVDDLHRAGPTFLDLFAVLVEELLAEPVLFAAATRHGILDEREDAAVLLAHDAIEAHELEPFDREQTRQKLQAQLDRVDVPEAFVDRLYRRTGGNPLFLEELVDALVEAGELDPKAGVFPAPEETTLPAAVEEAIAARFAHLDDEPIECLELASVLGVTYRLDHLEACLDLEAATVREYVDLFVAADLLERAGTRCQFTSEVIRTAIYEQIDSDRRRQLHEAVARTLEAEAADQAAVAHHYEAADMAQQALDHRLEAAQGAREAYAHEDALDYFADALVLAEAVENTDQRHAALQAIGRTHEELGEFEAAIKHYSFIQQEATDPATIQRALYRKAQCLQEVPEYERAMELVEDGLEYGTTEYTPKLHHTKGTLHYRQRAFDAAEQAYRRALELAQEHELQADRAAAIDGLGIVSMERGDLEIARQQFEDALELFDEQKATLPTLSNLGVVERRLGDPAAAVEWYERALSIAEETGYKKFQAHVKTNISNAQHQLGNLEYAIDCAEEALELAEQIGAGEIARFCRVNLGNFTRQLGDFEAARPLLQQVGEEWTELGKRPLAARVQLILGVIALWEDDPDTAIEQCRAGLDLLEDESIDLGTRLTARLAQASAVAGECDRAMDRLETVRGRLDGVEEVKVEITVEIAAIVVHRECGDLEAARTAATAVRESGTQIGDPHVVLEGLVELARTELTAGEDDRARTLMQEVREQTDEHDHWLCACDQIEQELPR